MWIIIAVLLISLMAILLVFIIEPVVVNGSSMYPTYKDGEIIVILKVGFKIKLKDVICFRTKSVGDRILLKRVAHVSDDEVFVVGDNLHNSRDSRHFGGVSKRLIVGKVIKARHKKLEQAEEDVR